jgi:uncharacterized repeat protein (TIGR02543 family)
MGSHFIKRIGYLAVALLAFCASAVFAGILTGVSVTPGDVTAGATTTYTFTYTVETQVGQDEAILYVDFPPEFSLGMGSACDWVTITLDTPDDPPAGTACNGSYGSGNTVAVAVNTLAFGGPSVPADTVVEIVVSDVTNPATPGDYVFETGGGPGFDTGIRTVLSPDMFPPVAIDYADEPQTVTIVGGPVDGSCGIAHMGVFAIDPPSETLCETGVDASFSANATDYTWACDSTNGGTSANCSASLGYLITPAVTAGGTFDCAPDLVPYDGTTTCTAAPNSGYDFSGWGTGDCDGVVTLECVLNNVIDNPVLEALFTTSPTFTITTAVSPSSAAGTATCTPNPVDSGSNASCSASAKTGYTFSNWSGDCTGKSCSFTAIAADKSITANFTLKTYSLSGTASPALGGSVNCSGSVSHGSNGSCTATGATGYTFSGWADCPSASGSTCNFTNVTANKSVTANFTIISYTVTGAADPAAAASVNCTSPVNHGTSTSCTATPVSGFNLTGWTGCTSSSGTTCTLTNVTANASVTATLAVATYTLAGSASPVAGGSVICNSPVIHGANGTCTATANNGYSLVSWSGCSSTDGNSCTVTNMTANKSVSATFVINSYSVTAVANPIDAGLVKCTNPVNHGSSASCTATAAAGYRLKDWSGACTGASCAITNVTANASVTANFELLPIYNVSTSVSPADSGKITCTKDIMEGSTGTCAVKANAGYRFTGWGGDCSGTDATCKLENVASAKNVTASFEQASQFTITASIEAPNGTIESTDMYGPSTIETFARGLKCSANNPVAQGTSFSCSFDFGLLSSGEKIKGFSGDCSRVEGYKCYVDNIATDKHIVIQTGELITFAAVIQPAGAGSLWCNTNAYLKITADTAARNCKAEANPGYVFTSYVEQEGVVAPIIVNFTKQTNAPAVTCTDCNSSSTTTDTSTTTTVTSTTQPDTNGKSTESTVAVTKEEAGTTSTNVIVTGSGSTSSNVVTIAGSDTQVTVGSNGVTDLFIGGTGALQLSTEGLTGSLVNGGGSGITLLNASSNNGVTGGVFDYDFSNGNDNSINFVRPVTIKIPVGDTTSDDSDLLTLAKIINGKLEYYGGRYNDNGFNSSRNGFKPRAKPAADNSFAFIRATWSENLNSNLVMEGTDQITLTQHRLQLDDASTVRLQTLVGIADKTVTTTLTMSNGSTDDADAVTGNLETGFAVIQVEGANGSFAITDKQAPADDQRKVSFVLNNGRLESVALSSDAGASQTFYMAAVGDNNAAKITSFETGADSFSITLTIPAAN